MSTYDYSGHYLTGNGYSEDISGSYGDDDIYGAGGDDYITGNSGNDILDGGQGDDSLYGGSGDDVLWAGYGEDDLTGGFGSDIFAIYAEGDFVIHDFSTSFDTLFFDPKTTGIYDMGDLLDAISDITEYQQGIVIDFYEHASITLVGLYCDDLSWVTVGFN